VKKKKKSKMKKINILSIFKTVNEYVQQLTMLIIGLIPLLLLGVVIFGDNFFLGNAVVYNIQNILDSMAGFVGLVTLILIVYFYSRTTSSK
jgi:choline-glycine betaine transporter